MSLRMFATVIIAVALALGAQEAQAGSVRFAGKKIAQGAGMASDGVQAAGG